MDSGELKTEKGKHVYEFAIKDAKGKMRDVWVDEKSGRVVRNTLRK